MSQSRLSIIPSRAVSDASLTATHLRVLCAIGSFTGKDQSAYPKQSTIAEVIGVSRETVNRSIKLLKERGYIDVADQFRDDGGQRASLYSVRLDPCDEEITPPVIKAPPCDPVVTPPVTYTITPPVTPVITPKNDPIERYTNADALVSAQSATPPEKPKRKASPRGASRRTSLPKGWAPNAANYAYASKNGLSREEINHEENQFRNDAIAEGRLHIDWNAAFSKWLGNTVKWRAERAGNRKNAGSRPNDSDRFISAVYAAADRAEHIASNGRSGFDVDTPHVRVGGAGAGSAREPYTIEGVAHASQPEAGGRPSGPDGPNLPRDPQDREPGGSGGLLDLDFHEAAGGRRVVGF